MLWLDNFPITASMNYPHLLGITRIPKVPARALVAGVMALGVSLAISAFATQESVIEGTWRVAVADDMKNKKAEFYQSVKEANGKETRVVVDGPHPDIEPGTPVRVRGMVRAGTITVPTVAEDAPPVRGSAETKPVGNSPKLQAVGPPPVEASVMKQRKTAVIMFNFKNDTRQPYTAEQVRQTVFTGTRSANAFFQESSSGSSSLVGKTRVDGDIYGWHTINQTSNDCANVLGWATEAFVGLRNGGAPLDGYDQYLYVIPQTQSCQWSGVAWIGTPDAVINYLNTFVVAHEIGHNFGMGHASTLDCDDAGCMWDEYGDSFSVMGGGPSAPDVEPRHPSNYHKATAGWLPKANWQIAMTSGEYTIDAATGLNGQQILQIPIAGFPPDDALSYTLELRRPAGQFDNFGVGDPVVNGLTIRFGESPEVDWGAYTGMLDAHPATPTFDDAALNVGETYDDGMGNRITLMSMGSSNARVKVEIKGTPLHEYANPRTADNFFRPDRDDETQTGYGYYYNGCDMNVLNFQAPGTVPLHRLWSNRQQDNLFTVNPNEPWYPLYGYEPRDGDGRYGFVYPGNIAQPAGTAPWHRYWNTNITDHLYSTYRNDQFFGGHGYRYQKIEAYGLPAPANRCR